MTLCLVSSISWGIKAKRAPRQPASAAPACCCRLLLRVLLLAPVSTPPKARAHRQWQPDLGSKHLPGKVQRYLVRGTKSGVGTESVLRTARSCLPHLLSARLLLLAWRRRSTPDRSCLLDPVAGVNRHRQRAHQRLLHSLNRHNTVRVTSYLDSSHFSSASAIIHHRCSPLSSNAP